jgi:acyl-phosphate glycerol 3-phosphate acyltransferase
VNLHQEPDLQPMNALLIVLSYLVGSIPFGFLIAKRRGIDIREAGSGNIGATNVGRLLGKRLGMLVFALDFAKGALPVALARWAFPDEWVAVAAGLAAFLGHIFPIWLRFKGGKGVATGAGVVAVLMPLPALGAILVWLVFVVSTNHVSLASMISTAAMVGLHLAVEPEPFAPGKRIVTVFAFLAFALVVVRHRENFSRLLSGRESPLRESLSMNTAARIIHVLALSLWFGGGVFFTFVVAIQLFAKLEALGSTPPGERPEWLALPTSFDKPAATRLAGETISPMFSRYFLMQGVCGVLALVTSLRFWRDEPGWRVHRLRFWLLALALLTVIIGWPLEQHVGTLRLLRNQGDEAATAAFGMWHTISLFLNFATILVVTAATALTALLPNPWRHDVGSL